MPIEFQCPGCGATLRVNDEAKGRQAQCPKCGKIAQLPDQLSSTLPAVLSGQAAPGQVDEHLSPLELIPSRIDLGSVISRSWKVYTAEFGLCLAVIAVFLAIQLAVGCVSNNIPISGDSQIVIGIARWVLDTWLAAGLTLFFLKAVRGQTLVINDLFAGGKYLLRLLGLYFVLAVFFGIILFVGCLLPAAIGYIASAPGPEQKHAVALEVRHVAQEKQEKVAEDDDNSESGKEAEKDEHPEAERSEEQLTKEQKTQINSFISAIEKKFQEPQTQVAIMVFIVACLIWLVPIMILGLMFSQSQYLVVDRDVGIVDALKLSIKITRGNKWSLFLLGLFGSLLVFSGLLACFIGLLFVLPLLYLFGATAYLTMSGEFSESPAEGSADEMQNHFA
jgi:uncharacterized membrane protein